MPKNMLISRWKTQLKATGGQSENPAGFVEILDYDLVLTGGLVIPRGDTSGLCCRGANTCCCYTHCTCPAPQPPIIIVIDPHK